VGTVTRQIDVICGSIFAEIHATAAVQNGDYLLACVMVLVTQGNRDRGPHGPVAEHPAEWCCGSLLGSNTRSWR
jgi:hypothetical protein